MTYLSPFPVRGAAPAYCRLTLCRPLLRARQSLGGRRCLADAVGVRVIVCALPPPGLEQLVEREDVKARDVELGVVDRCSELLIELVRCRSLATTSARIPRCLRRNESDGPTPIRADSSSSLVRDTLPGTPITTGSVMPSSRWRDDPGQQGVGVKAHLRGHVVGEPALVGQRLRERLVGDRGMALGIRRRCRSSADAAGGWRRPRAARPPRSTRRAAGRRRRRSGTGRRSRPAAIAARMPVEMVAVEHHAGRDVDGDVMAHVPQPRGDLDRAVGPVLGRAGDGQAHLLRAAGRPPRGSARRGGPRSAQRSSGRGDDTGVHHLKPVGPMGRWHSQRFRFLLPFGWVRAGCRFGLARRPAAGIGSARPEVW